MLGGLLGRKKKDKDNNRKKETRKKKESEDGHQLPAQRATCDVVPNAKVSTSSPEGMTREFKKHDKVLYKEAKSLPSHLRKESLQQFYSKLDSGSKSEEFLLKKVPRNRPSLDEVFPEVMNTRESNPVAKDTKELDKDQTTLSKDPFKPKDPDAKFYSLSEFSPTTTGMSSAAKRRSTISTGSPSRVKRTPRSPEIVTDIRAKLSGKKVIERGSTDRYHIVDGKKTVLDLESEFRIVLEDPKKLALFEKFAKKELSLEALMFWKEAENFRKKDFKKENINTVAQSIFKKYFDPKSTYSINIDSEVRATLQNELKDPHPFVFIEAQIQIFELMKNDSFRRFRMTPEYLTYLEKEEIAALTG